MERDNVFRDALADFLGMLAHKARTGQLTNDDVNVLARAIRPAGLDAYLSYYGYHFSPAMARWAVSMMEPRNGGRMQIMDKEAVEKLLEDREIDFRKARGHDLVYIANMIVADRWGSSVKDEDQLALAIKDEMLDPDGYEGMAFSRFLSDCNAKGIPIVWEDMI